MERGSVYFDPRCMLCKFQVADYYVKSDEEERALEALHTYIVRAREYNQPAEDQKNTHFCRFLCIEVDTE